MPLKAPKGFIREDDHRVSQIGHPAPPWLVNYADLMTEMVAFFVILYALGAALNKDMISAQRVITDLMKEEKIPGQVEIHKDGMKITMQEGSDEPGSIPFFQSGKADLTPKMMFILQKLTPKLIELAKKDFDVLVEGHTDNVPIVGALYLSNWELSSARATVVLRYLIDVTSFPPNKIGAVGYGEFRPEAPNDTEENRRKNRRVVFFVRNPPQKFEPAEAGEKGKE